MFKKNERKGMKQCPVCGHFCKSKELTFKGRYGKLCQNCLNRKTPMEVLRNE